MGHELWYYPHSKIQKIGIKFMLSNNVNLYPALVEFGEEFLEP